MKVISGILFFFMAVSGIFADDAYEANNTLAEAYALPVPNVWLSTLLGEGVAVDDDWFEIEVPVGFERVTVDCQFLAASGDIDLELYNGSGTLLASSATIDDNEAIDFSVTTPGTHYIRVVPYDVPSGGTSYDLKWSALAPPPSSAEDDEYENNDDYPGAYPLAEKVWLSDLLGKGVQTDEDYYRIEVSPGYETVSVECVFTNADGDIDIYLLNTMGTVIDSSLGISDSEQIVKSVYAPGTYYIKVICYPSDSGNTYDLWWDDFPSAGTIDDEYEANNDPGTAFASLKENSWLSSLQGRGVQLDQDWYAIEISPGTEQIEIDCRFTNAVGNLDVALHDPQGQLLTNATSATDNEYILFPVASTGTYYIVVGGAGGLSKNNSYDLWWDDVPAASPVDDEYEENDDLSRAYPFVQEGIWLSTLEGPAIQANDDWYAIEITPGFLWVQADCLFSHAEGDINLALFDSASNEVASSLSIDNNESIMERVPSPGLYYLRVYYGNTGSTYDLKWDDRDALLVQTDDAYEENDDMGAAYALVNSKETWLSDLLGEGIMLDDDWFAVSVTGPVQRVLVDCKFSHVAGDIDVELYDASATVLESSTSSADSERIDVEVPPGNYFVRVFGYGIASGNSYDLWWSTATPSNSAPYGLSVDAGFVEENSPAGTWVGTLQTDDENLGDTFTYALVPGLGGDDNHRFMIAGDQLFTAEMLDYEQTISPTIRIRTTDSTGLWYELPWLIDVFDVDETPMITGYALPGNGDVILSWSSMVNNSYAVEASTNLLEGFDVVESNLWNTPPENTFTGGISNARQTFWRIVIEED